MARHRWPDEGEIFQVLLVTLQHPSLGLVVEPGCGRRWPSQIAKDVSNELRREGLISAGSDAMLLGVIDET